MKCIERFPRGANTHTPLPWWKETNQPMRPREKAAHNRDYPFGANRSSKLLLRANEVKINERDTRRDARTFRGWST